QHGQSGLGADRVVDFRLRVESDAEGLFHEVGCRFFEGEDAVVGVAAVFQLVDLAFGDLAHQGVGHVVVFPDAEVEERPLRMGGQEGRFGWFDLPELVDFGAQAVAGAADAVGKQVLKPGSARVAHRQGASLARTELIPFYDTTNTGKSLPNKGQKGTMPDKWS